MKVTKGVYTALLATALLLGGLTLTPAGPGDAGCWRVEDVRTGMTGEGLTVIKGTRVQKFAAEVLGVMKNTSPGRDLVLCRLSGCDLEKTGVIAGMSGSPVYIDGKLLGAVAYAWPFGKEPIAGVTPFCQMKQYAEPAAGGDFIRTPQGVGSPPKLRQSRLPRPAAVGGREYDAVTVCDGFDDPAPATADGLWLQPLRTPLLASGFTPGSLALLREKLGHTGMVPVQGGGVSAAVAAEAMDTPLEPGGALTVALVTGDFDLSGIGTVTHVEGDRVYGWGHPFLGVGACEFPMMTGYVHAIYPRQNLSFKMGSPLRTVGVIAADVSTCIAGTLGREPDMMPVRMTVRRETDSAAKTFNVRVVRQPALLPNLVFTTLTNSIDMEGELPEEMTADLRAVIRVEGHEPIVIEDTYSGSVYSGGRASRLMYSGVASVLSSLLYNTHEPVRLEGVDCETHIRPGRRTADIEAVELDAPVYRPGETVTATVLVRPHLGTPEPVPVELKLPDDLPEGTYTARVFNDVANVREELRDRPNLANPQTTGQVFESLRLKNSGKHTQLVLRVPLEDIGVAVNGHSLRDLPPSMVHILANGRRTGARTIAGALVARRATDWVIDGSESVRFQVSRHKRSFAGQ